MTPEQPRRLTTAKDERALRLLHGAAESGKLFDDLGIELWMKALSSVKRFEGTPMIHQTDLWVHSRRTAYLADVVRQMAEPFTDENLDQQDIFWMGMHHDDGELLGGDVPSPVKRAMTLEEREVLRQEEHNGVKLLAELFQHSQKERYIRLHDEVTKKETLSAQIVDTADKMDGLGETIHEIRCGNEDFYTPLENYREIFGEFEGRPFWRELKDHPYLRLNMIPSKKEVEEIPKINIEDLKDKETAWQNLLKGPMPVFYRTWLSLTLQVFDIRPEKYLLSGWYLELWKHWGPPKDTTTLSGIYLPK